MPARTSERGAALLVVMVAVAILTALAVQLAYDTRVELQLAGNARDRLRAEYLARSGVAMSRMVLALQEQLDAGTSAAQTAASNALRAAGGASAASAGAGAFPSIRLWSAVPVNSGLVQALFGGGAGGGGEAAAPSTPTDAPAPARFGDFEGLFAAEIEDEFAKLDAQLDAQWSGGALRAQVLGLWQLVCDPRWDPIFDREDANGVRVPRHEVLLYLRDWTDEGTESSSLAASFPGAACAIDVQQNPFERGFGDENYPYDRGEDRYKAKNARFDSLDELYLVNGVSDAFMAAFGDKLTVYLPRGAKGTIDPRNQRLLVQRAMMMADPPDQPAFHDPEFPPRLQREVLLQTMNGLLNISGAQLGQILSALGVQVNAAATDPKSPQSFLGERSTVFRIRSTGAAGDVEARIDAVVSMAGAGSGGPGGGQGPAPGPRPQGQAQPRPPAQGQTQMRATPPGQNLGRLVRWREE